MSDLPYFQLYVGDYDRKTAHLSAVEDGMYFRLLRLCWTSPGCKIPADEAWIMRKTRARTDEEQAAVRAVIEEFFRRGKGKLWNDRLVLEFAKANEVHAGRVKGGKNGSAAKALKNNKLKASSVKAERVDQAQLSTGYTSEGHISDSGGGGSACERADDPPLDAHPTFRERILKAIGIDQSGMTGRGGTRIGTAADMEEAKRWLGLGVTADEILIVVTETVAAKRDGPPKSFSYFTPAMTRFAAAKAAPPLSPDQIQLPQRGSHHARPDQTERLQRIISAAATGTTGQDWG